MVILSMWEEGDTEAEVACVKIKDEQWQSKKHCSAVLCFENEKSEAWPCQ